MVETRGMTHEKLTLSVRPRGKPVKKLPEEVNVSATSTLLDLYNELASQAGTTIHRLRVTKGSDGAFLPNTSGVLVDATGLRHQSTIYVKDLGPQIPWRTVFLVEYAGPLFIFPACWAIFPDPRPSYLQNLTLAMVLIHFGKRELETLFIHRFSAATMPAFNIFKNSAHYWLLSGLNMAYWINLPTAAAAEESNLLITYVGIALFAVGELGNFSNHLTLRNLRSVGGKERGIPKGLGFDLVTCPNYMFEAISWIGVALVSWSLSTVLFIVIAVGQMGLWAKKKEAKYRKEFGSKYQRKRYAMLPGIW